MNTQDVVGVIPYWWAKYSRLKILTGVHEGQDRWHGYITVVCAKGSPRTTDPMFSDTYHRLVGTAVRLMKDRLQETTIHPQSLRYLGSYGPETGHYRLTMLKGKVEATLLKGVSPMGVRMTVFSYHWRRGHHHISTLKPAVVAKLAEARVEPAFQEAKILADFYDTIRKLQ